MRESESQEFAEWLRRNDPEFEPVKREANQVMDCLYDSLTITEADAHQMASYHELYAADRNHPKWASPITPTPILDRACTIALAAAAAFFIVAVILS